MKAKMIASMLVLALAAALVGGATMAIFTDTDTNTGNTFTAGTVSIQVGVSSIGVGAGNMAPGDTITGTFTVTNNGTLQLRYDVSALAAGPLFAGATPAQVGALGDDQDIVLAPGASATVTFTVHLPLGAGNTYQNATGTIDFTISAEQTANN